MSKQNPDQAPINNANQAFSSIEQLVNSLTSQFNSLSLPALQTLFPMLTQTAEGAPTAISRAAEAPVKAQTAESIGQIDSNLGGVTNPNSLIQDVTRQGQQAAGLAEDQTVGSSVSSLQSLISGQEGLLSSGISGLGTAGAGEAGLAGILANQPSQFQQILGDAGSVAGIAEGDPFSGKGGKGGGATTGGSSVYGNWSTPLQQTSGVPQSSFPVSGTPGG
jgi:hypothetical protein